jgi:hypothetical protein
MVAAEAVDVHQTRRDNARHGFPCSARCDAGWRQLWFPRRRQRRRSGPRFDGHQSAVRPNRDEVAVGARDRFPGVGRFAISPDTGSANNLKTRPFVYRPPCVVDDGRPLANFETKRGRWTSFLRGQRIPRARRIHAITMCRPRFEPSAATACLMRRGDAVPEASRASKRTLRVFITKDA